MIKLNRNILFFGSWLLSLLAAASSLYNKDNYFISLITFLYFIFIPGFLILRALAIRKLSILENIILSIGLSIFFLLVPGLLFNWIMPIFGITSPLQTDLLTIYFGLLVIILINIGYFRNKELEWKLEYDPKFLKKFYFIIPPIVTLIGIFGTNQLNNTGDNFFAVITYSLVIIIFFITILLHKRINSIFLPWAIYWCSLTMLLSLSLRSLYVSGWDIQAEFKMFQVTKIFGIWSPDNWEHAYNACLSITLLPTIISKLIVFPDDYVFKLLFQIIFAIAPVVIYQIFKSFSSPILAFIAVIYIISQPVFIQPMTALMRQEISLFFFVFLYYVLFQKSFSWKIRSILYSMFAFSMVVSHYSTTYVTIMLFLLSYPLIGMFQLSQKVPLISKLYYHFHINDITVKYKYYLDPILLIILLVFTFFWYGLINDQLGKVQQVAVEGLTNMNQLFKTDVSSDDTRLATTFLNSQITTKDDLEIFTNQVLSRVSGDSYRLYSPVTYANSNSFPMNFRLVQPIFRSQINNYVIISLEIFKQILKLTVMLSPLYLTIMYFRKDKVPREYIIISGVAVLIIGIMTFHPTLGLEYGLSRFYLQLLFFLALPAILLCNFIFYPFKQKSIHILGFTIVILFSYLNGILYQFLGGEARMYFNNYGADYDKFYVHKEELISAKWLEQNVYSSATVFADQESNLRISRIFDRSHNRNILPPLIFKDAYVYASYSNIVSNISIIHNSGQVLVFSFPKLFLDENKDIVYSNGGSKIYR